IAWNDFVYGISLTSTDAARPVPAALSFFTGASQFEEPTGAISAAAHRGDDPPSSSSSSSSSAGSSRGLTQRRQRIEGPAMAPAARKRTAFDGVED
ncbi:hypothetical protein HR12_43665, partial [Microbacterium sp. SUBG005]